MTDFTDARGARQLLFDRGYQVLHALCNGTGQSPRRGYANEWSGVVELRHPLENLGGAKELRALLAQSFDLDSDDIKILHWARLH